MLAQTSDEIAEEKKVFEKNMDINMSENVYAKKIPSHQTLSGTLWADCMTKVYFSLD